jgi:hypothetical protein
MPYQGGKPRGVKVHGRSRQEIRAISDRIRETLNLLQPRLDVQRFLEHDLFAKAGIVFHVAKPEEMGKNEALTFPDRDEIHIRADVYDALTRGDLRARFTVVHEFAHWLLHPDLGLGRSSPGSMHQFFEDSEWQADAFAAEFLMPKNLLVKHCRTAVQAAAMFGVSLDTAIVRVNVLRAEGLMRR